MKRLLVSSILLLLFIGGIEAGGFALEGVGPRALSLGGAYRSLAQDWSAIYWNPAGLAFADRPSISISSAFVSPFSSAVLKTGLLGYDGGYPLKYRVASASQLFTIPSTGGVYPFKMYTNWGVGASLFVPFGLGAKWNLYDPPIGYYDPGFEPNPPFPEYNWESKIEVVSLFAGFAVRFGKHVSLGFSFGPSYLSADLKRVNLIDIADIDTQAIYGPIQYRYMPLVVHVKGTGNNFGVSLGMIVSLLEDRLRLGFSFLRYQEADLSGDYNFSLYLPKNQAIQDQLSDPAEKLLFSGSVLSSTGDVKVTLPLPRVAGMSISYSINPQWLIAVGAEKTKWSVLQDIPLDFRGGLDPMGQPLENDSLPMRWKDTWRFGGGVEYTPSEIVALRLGVTYDNTPIPKETFTPLLPDVGKKLGFNIGIRYRIMERYLLEARYEFLRANKTTYTGFEDVDSDGSPDNIPGSYSLSVDTFEFGITWEF